jgi:hypothetical protein
MDPITALQIVGTIVSAVKSEQDQAEQQQQMKSLLSDVDNLKSLVENIKNVINQAFIDQTIDEANASIRNAFNLFHADNATPDEKQQATFEVGQAASRLEEPKVQVAGALSFLAAAGAHLAMLSEMSHIGQLRQFAADYSSHASNLWPGVELTVGARIGIGSEVAFTGYVKVYYMIDGQDQPGDALLVPQSAAQRARDFQEGKKVRDYKKLAAPITYTLRMAAETWRCLAGGITGQENYAGIFDGIAITAVNPDQPWAYVTVQPNYFAVGKLAFQEAKPIKHITQILFVVPQNVYSHSSLPYLGAIIQSAKCISVNTLTPAGLLIDGGSHDNLLAVVDDGVIIADNQSAGNCETVDGKEWSKHLPWLELHRDKYEVFKG